MNLAVASACATLVLPAYAQQADGATVVVVSGQRAALQSAQKIKQNADEIVDSIVADDIGKLPDRSVTEVLQRVVGVTMDRSMAGDPQHYAVEGSGVAIRGLNYVRSELNGRDSFSANGGRALNFEDVPPELMAGVDVYKNPSAEQIEGAISGLVNLRTAMPFDFKGFKGSVSGQKSYSTLKEGKATPSASLMLSDRWKTGIGEIGLLVDLAKSQSDTRTDAIKIDAFYPRDNVVPGKTVWVPKGALWRTQDFERERQGQYAAAQWRPFTGLTTALTYFKSDYHMKWSEQAMLMQHTTPYDIKVSDATYDANGMMLTGTLSDPEHGGINYNPDRRVATRDSSTTDVNWNVQWRVSPQWTVRNDLQRIRARSEGFDSDVATGLQIQSQRLDLTGGMPNLIFTDAQRAMLADPNQYYWAYTMEHRDRSKADSKAWKTDVQYEFDHSVLRDLRFGVRLTDRNSHTHNSNPSYNWQAITQPWMLGWNISQLAYLGDPRFSNETNVHTYPNFFNGKTSVPSVVFPNDSLAVGYPGTYEALHKYYDIVCKEQTTKQGWGSCDFAWKNSTFGTDPAEINDVSERTKAFYSQLRFGFDDLKYPIDGNIGLRYVRTNSTAAGYTVFKPSVPTFPPGASVSGVAIPDIAAFSEQQDFANSYSNVLPSLNLRMKASEKLQFRLALGKAMSRPDFSQLQGYTTLMEEIKTSTNEATKAITVNSVSLTGTGAGNPMLKPTTSKQLDVTAEWYFAPSGSLTVAVFNKQLKDIIVNQLNTYDVAGADGKTHSFTITSPVNGARGHARGFEVAYQQYYDNLPEWLSGLGVQASFTFVDSKRKLYNPVFSPYCTTGDGAVNVNLYVNGCDTDGRSFGNLPLQGLSRQSGNLSLMYDKGPVSARLAYNWRSKNLQAVNTWGTRGTDGKDTNSASPTYGATNIAWGLPLWADAYGQLDASIFYKITEKLQFGLEAQNLNKAVFKQLMQQHAGTSGHSWFATGPRYTAQLRYSF
ncbi:TonB-dependent receptor [Pseudoduganella namucuonensis]|nr:TonB-dependent receptor [Pseudoduganella namucuonensis]